MKTARVRIWARPHAAPHLRRLIEQPDATRSVREVRRWSSAVIADDEPPLAVAMVAFDIVDGVIRYRARLWSDTPLIPLGMLPDMARVYMTREITADQARRDVMDELGLGAPPDHSA